ncbi:hypothetical protein DFQ14_12115 [Halopolyspora algeriensis]|uniref:4-amino-4-deoxy-L-arabinose transferase-like glycosyltransferase n=1 Tax=Halopolyspora algeriensis TaxID=1500506 RepID=A0A368VCU9_9ACTN|nr:DUF6541 family protein [Halopolyspora algeriensis]RCW38513.1 hypothetical protein DFQ14_12115 [Halopolyspora algeriensis]TQM42594.1 hypothetical protein FHU43_4229 [Halopolyspora algeriensis]
MSWLDAVPALVAAVAWLLVPGVLSSYALGLRGLAAWTVAPVFSTAVIAVSAIVFGKLGIAWSASAAGAAALVPAAAFLLVRLAFGRGFSPAVRPDQVKVRLAGWLGLLPALAIGLSIIVQGFRTPANLSQTYDAVFHYNALRWVLESGNASSLALGSFGSSFYPAAWHDITSLAVLSSAAPLPVAANMTTAAIAVFMWPLACLFLSRQIFGPSIPALAITGTASVAFAAFPWGLLHFGVLWPNALSFALVPIGVGAGLSILGMTTQGLLNRTAAWVLFGTTLVATGLAQPNATFSIAALLLLPGCHALVSWMHGQHRAGRTTRGLLGGAAVLALAVASWVFVHSLSRITSVKNYDRWQPFQSITAAVGEVLLNATNGRDALWLLSAAVVAGMFFAFRSRITLWLPFAHVGLAALFVMAAAVQTSTTHIFTGFWYNDSHRLAAMLPITGVLLAVGGVIGTAAKLREWAHTRELPSRMRNTRLISVPALTGALGALLLVVTTTWYQNWAVESLRMTYRAVGSSAETLVESSEQEFYSRVDRVVPDDAVVAGDPWDGSAMLWALTGTHVLFPHLNPSSGNEYLAEHLNEAATDPKVCRLMSKLNVRYAIEGTSQYWLSNPGNDSYPGLTDLSKSAGFELVEQQGPLRLYRITACDPELASHTPEPRSGA